MHEFFENLTENEIFQKQFRNISEKLPPKESQKLFTESFLKHFSLISEKVFFLNFAFNGKFQELCKNIPDTASDECISEMIP